MSCKTFNECHLDAVAAVMDDIAGRDSETDPARKAIEAYREIKGTAEYRRACFTFATITETLLNSYPDDVREDIFDAYLWDFEYIPELINCLAARGDYWFEASLESLKETHNQMMIEKSN